MKKFLCNIFSIKNAGQYVIVSFLGLKLKFKSETNCKILYLEKELECADKFVNSIENYIINSVLLFSYPPPTELSGILLVSHALGGGTETYINNYIDDNRAEKTIFYLQYKLDDLYILKIFEKEKKIEIPVNFQILENVLTKVCFDEIIVNSFVTYNIKNIIDLILRIAKPCTKVSYMAHDFHALCPGINLLSSQGIYCNLPDIETCQKCFEKITPKDFEFSTISAYREEYESFFKKRLDEITFFSKNSEGLFLKVFSCLEGKRKVTPHKIQPLRKCCIVPHKKINIGFLGCNHVLHKGAGIIREINEMIKNRSDINLISFGSSTIIDSEVFKNCGKYDVKDLSDLFEREQIDIIFITSICPETFSYTTSESMSTSIPVACFNIGAPPERVSKYDKGLIIDKIDAKYALDRIVNFVMERRSNAGNRQ